MLHMSCCIQSLMAPGLRTHMSVVQQCKWIWKWIQALACNTCKPYRCWPLTFLSGGHLCPHISSTGALPHPWLWGTQTRKKPKNIILNFNNIAGDVTVLRYISDYVSQKMTDGVLKCNGYQTDTVQIADPRFPKFCTSSCKNFAFRKYQIYDQDSHIFWVSFGWN